VPHVRKPRLTRAISGHRRPAPQVRRVRNRAAGRSGSAAASRGGPGGRPDSAVRYISGWRPSVWYYPVSDRGSSSAARPPVVAAARGSPAPVAELRNRDREQREATAGKRLIASAERELRRAATDEREADADQRERIADADLREADADLREADADLREADADLREADADERDRIADQREADDDV
jgi:hypothetical protein